MNWQVQPSSNASVVPGGGIRFIDISGEVVRIDGSFVLYGRGLVNDFRKPTESTPLPDRADLVAAELFMVCQRRSAATTKIRERSAPPGCH